MPILPSLVDDHPQQGPIYWVPEKWFKTYVKRLVPSLKTGGPQMGRSSSTHPRVCGSVSLILEAFKNSFWDQNLQNLELGSLHRTLLTRQSTGRLVAHGFLGIFLAAKVKAPQHPPARSDLLPAAEPTTSSVPTPSFAPCPTSRQLSLCLPCLRKPRPLADDIQS